jgi:hypothetical protein
MKKLSLEGKITLYASVLAVSSLAILTCSTFALFQTSTSGTGELPGDVGLRSYFETGDGSETDPYVISRPMHFYNLSRLQNLGVFGTKTYFSLGYDIGSTGVKKFYANDSDSTTSTYLDMSSYSSILAVGSEGTPFYGDFNGNSLEIRGLQVNSGPEDVGVFGYTYSGSNVHDVFFNDLTVSDDGYDNSVTNLGTLYTTTDTTANYRGTVTIGSDTMTTTFKEGYALTSSLTFTKPTSWPSNVSYDLRCSSDYFTIADNNAGAYTITINSSTDTTDATDITHNTDFKGSHTDSVTPNGVEGAQFSSRFSLVGTIFDETSGLSYSKIISSFTLVFVNSTSTGVTYKVALDSSDETADSPYTHGSNIGFVCGHCDGSLKNCYIYNGTLSLNGSASDTIKKVAQESETGLVGEIGPGIDNKFSPGQKYDTNGDTGIINFTKMYSNIVGSSSFTFVKDTTTGNYYTFSPQVASGEDGEIFKKYLRDNKKTGTYFAYVTNAENSIDFAGQQVIQDNDNSDGVDRGLGVFKLATGSKDNTGATSFATGLGDFAVSKQTSFSDFYYTTAEYQDSTPTANMNGTSKDNNTAGQTSTLKGWTQSQWEHLHLGKTIPSYSDSYTWAPFLERHFAYYFHCDLASNATKNYFYNTDSPFLQDYFSYKLVGQDGASVAPKTSDFGVFVKDSDTSTGVTTNITSLDSCLSIAAPTNGYIPVSDSSLDASKQTPYNSIEFSIKSDYANVTVFASSGSGASSYVGVYDKSKVLNTSYNVQPSGSDLSPANGKRYSGYRRPSYAMYVPSYNGGDSNFCAFNYSYATGITSTTATYPSKSGSPLLFAHTFKLPKGEYYLGAPDNSIKIYYVCAQGQNGEGNFGNKSNVFSDTNVIEDVDFISTTPSTFITDKANSIDDRCYLSFEASFTNGAGDLSCTYNSTLNSGSSVITKPSNLTSALILNEKNKNVVFDGTLYTDQFIHYPALSS